jgi:hypothetical protein
MASILEALRKAVTTTWAGKESSKISPAMIAELRESPRAQEARAARASLDPLTLATDLEVQFAGEVIREISQIPEYARAGATFLDYVQTLETPRAGYAPPVHPAPPRAVVEARELRDVITPVLDAARQWEADAKAAVQTEIRRRCRMTLEELDPQIVEALRTVVRLGRTRRDVVEQRRALVGGDPDAPEEPTSMIDLLAEHVARWDRRREPKVVQREPMLRFLVAVYDNANLQYRFPGDLVRVAAYSEDVLKSLFDRKLVARVEAKG